MTARKGFSVVIVLTIIALTMLCVATLWRQHAQCNAISQARYLYEQKVSSTQLAVDLVQRWFVSCEKQLSQKSSYTITVQPLSCGERDDCWAVATLEYLKDSLLFSVQLWGDSDLLCTMRGELRKDADGWALSRRRVE